MTDIIKLTSVLTVITLAAAAAIAVTNSKTKDRIAEQQENAQKIALQQIMPPNVTIEQRQGGADGTPDQYWISQNGSDSLYAFKISSRGYAADIKYLVSLDSKGTIYGMTVLEQSETPGLGSRVQEVLSKNYIWNGLFGKGEAGLSWFTEQYKGINIFKQIGINKSVGEWHKLADSDRQKLISENSITAITGSTISTRAVTRGLESKARDYLNALRGTTHD